MATTADALAAIVASPAPGSNGVSRTADAAAMLAREAFGLAAIGLLCDEGHVHCRECGRVVERDVDFMGDVVFECTCGWLLWLP